MQKLILNLTNLKHETDWNKNCERGLNTEHTSLTRLLVPVCSDLCHLLSSLWGGHISHLHAERLVHEPGSWSQGQREDDRHHHWHHYQHAGGSGAGRGLWSHRGVAHRTWYGAESGFLVQNIGLMHLIRSQSRRFVCVLSEKANSPLDFYVLYLDWRQFGKSCFFFFLQSFQRQRRNLKRGSSSSPSSSNPWTPLPLFSTLPSSKEGPCLCFTESHPTLRTATSSHDFTVCSLRFAGRPGDYVYVFGDYRMEEVTWLSPLSFLSSWTPPGAE